MTGILKTFQTDGMGDGAFMFGQYDPNISGEQIVLAATTVALDAGTVLGMVAIGAATAAAKAGGNTGNGTITLDATTPVLAGAVDGAYTITCIAAATNGGTFRVEKPDGDVIGDVAVGATFADDIKFVIADGSTDFAVGDGFVVTVAAGSGIYKPLDPAANDGSQDFAAILFGRREISTSTQRATGVVRTQGVNANALKYVNALNATQKAKVEAQMRAKGIIPRY